jgi:hypothetical protein
MFRNNSRLDLSKAHNFATTVVMRQWKDWVNSTSNDVKQQTRAIVLTINDNDFWIEAENIITITELIYSVLRFSDGEGPRMEEIYERMDCMVGEIKDIMKKDDNPHKDDFVEVESIIIDRWEKMNLPLHCLAYALCPKFYHQQYINTPAPRGTIRQAPNRDKEVMTNVLAAFARIADFSRDTTNFSGAI